MADNELLELIDVLNKQLKKDRVTEADIEELDLVITGLDNFQIPDYRIAANVAGAVRHTINGRVKIDSADYDYKYAQEKNEELKKLFLSECGRYVNEALNHFQEIISNANEVNIRNISNNNKYLLKKIMEKAIVNMAKSKEYVMSIKIGDENKDTIDNIVSNLEAAETTLKGKLEELNKQFVDKRSPEKKISESATQVYNSYLLLHKLSELKVDELKADDEKKSLQEVISEAINKSKEQVEFEVKGTQYQVEITKEGNSYKLKVKVLDEHAKPEVPTDEEIIGLWIKSEVSIEKDESIKKDQNNNWAFAVGLHDKSRLRDLKVGGLGKKVPFNLRFANFYKVIEILKDEDTPLKERLRLANNIATGSGKTGDIALLKFWAYLTDTPCITMVPSDTLRTQSNKFDEEFLPDEVAMEFGEPFSEKNTRFATTTFKEALDTEWNLFNNTYGENNKEPALILIDEAPKLKENVVQMARSVEIARDNPIAFFSATPDAFLSMLFGIIWQILLSPKERAALGIGKIPVVHYHEMKFKTIHDMEDSISSVKEYDLRLTDPGKAYTEKIENTHERLNGYEGAVNKFKSEIENHGFDLAKLSQPFLDFIKSLDSQAYKEGLIATEERWAEDVTRAITDNDNGQERKKKRTDSFVKAIEGLNTGLTENNIRLLIEQNLNVEVGGQLLPYIKLHNIIDTLNEYKKSGEAVDKNEISKFIKDKYSIIDTNGTHFNSKLTDAILKLEGHRGYSEYKGSIKRNYPGDKELYEHIFQQFPDIKEFCEQDAVVHYFNGRVECFDSNGQKKGSLNDDDDVKNMLNVIKAGFVANAISKELALGIDAPRLSRAAAIIKDKTEMLDPMFLLQLMGRVGRNVEIEGLCYFDMFTSDESYLKIDDITTLSGEKLLKRLEESYKNYIQDEKGNIEGRAALLSWDIPKIMELGMFNEYRSYISIPNRIQNLVKDSFNYLNIQYCYDKETTTRVFTQVLKKVSCELTNILQIKSHNIKILKEHSTLLNEEYEYRRLSDFRETINTIDNAIKLLESKQIESSIVQYSDDMSLEDYARYIVHTKPMSYDDLLDQDPNSRAPTFMEQKQIFQKRNVSVHHASESMKPPSATGPKVSLGPKQTSTGGQQQVGFHSNSATQNKPSQQTSAKKKVMYGMMISSPFLAVGTYALVVGTAAAFNPIIAASIFIGAVLAALALFGTMKVYEKKKENPDMGVGTAFKEAFLDLVTPWSNHRTGCEAG